MRVLIALASAAHQISGVQRHAINVARCLLTRSEITAIDLIGAPWQQKFLRDFMLGSDARLQVHSAPIGGNAVSRNAWYYFQLPKLAAELRADIVHLAYPVPVDGRAFHCPTVVTLHDLYPYDVPRNFGFPKVIFNRLVLEHCLRAADAIACVSSSTLSRLERFAPSLICGRADVIRNCVGSQPQVSAKPLQNWKGQPFLLCVAQHRSNKNILFLLRVFARLLSTSGLAPETRLVIVGIEGPETNAIVRYITKAGLAERIFLLSGISEAELQWCYRNCQLLVAPSVTEGFGLPVAEALLAGCDVVCSDIPAFHEAGGDHCRYIPLDSAAEQAFVEAITAGVRAPSRKAVVLPHLSPQVIAEKYLRLYRSLLATPSTAKAPRPVASVQSPEKGPIA
jgi:glycosyltransferase involved in cell wall biosynthesis